MLDPIEDGITIGIEKVDQFVVERYHPICMICGDSITIKDITCVRIDIPISGTTERLHNSDDCFDMYTAALAYFYDNKPTGNLLSQTIQ